MKFKIYVLVILTMGSLGLMFWYGVHPGVLTQAEIDDYMATIGAQKQNPGGQHDLKSLRNFLETDDGKPFYTLNMYRFNDQAQYVTSSQSEQLSGSQAYQKFADVMIKLLAKQGSHPVFGSRWVSPQNNNWDQVVVVRYRSRKDMAEIFSLDAFAEASKHKWAAIEKNERLVIQALHLPELFIPLLLLTLLFFWQLVLMLLKFNRTNSG